MQLLPYCTLSLIDKDDFRQNTIGAVNNSENTVDELGDKIKVWHWSNDKEDKIFW